MSFFILCECGSLISVCRNWDSRWCPSDMSNWCRVALLRPHWRNKNFPRNSTITACIGKIKRRLGKITALHHHSLDRWSFSPLNLMCYGCKICGLYDHNKPYVVKAQFFFFGSFFLLRRILSWENWLSTWLDIMVIIMVMECEKNVSRPPPKACDFLLPEGKRRKSEILKLFSWVS